MFGSPLSRLPPAERPKPFAGGRSPPLRISSINIQGYSERYVSFSGGFATQTCADGGQSALVSAVVGHAELALIDWPHSVLGEIHQIVAHLVQPTGSLKTIVFVVVEVLLESLDFPFLVGSTGVKLFGSIVDGSTLLQPVGEEDTASVSTIAAETAVSFAGEVKESFV
jgi:hypothetical protein